MKLVFNRTWLTAHVQFCAADLRAALPTWVLPRAAARLSAEARRLPDGRVILPEGDAHRLWRRLGKALAGLPADATLRLFLGAVVPEHASFKVKRATFLQRLRGEWGRLSYERSTPRAEGAGLGVSAYGLAVLLGDALERSWDTFELEMLRGFAARIERSEPVVEELIAPQAPPSATRHDLTAARQITATPTRSGLLLSLSQAERRAQEGDEAALANARDVAAYLVEDDESVTFLDDSELLRAWRELALDARSWAGERSPHLLLAFLTNRHAAAKHAASNPPALDDEALPFDLEVSSDGMTATARVSEGAVPTIVTAPTTSKWSDQDLRAMLASRGIVHGVDSAALWRLATAIAAGDTPVTIEVAVGTKPRAPEGPYLRRISPHLMRQGRVLEVVSDDGVPLRYHQGPAIVRPYDPVAEVAWTSEGSAGLDVRGRPVAPTAPADVDVQPGPGCTRGHDGRLYATVTGVPELSGLTASVRADLVHDGNVNLATGDLSVTGPFVIDGSVDTGATVRATGDLTVTRLFRGAAIVCHGNLTLEGGAMCRTQADLVVGGDLTAGWLVGARVRCKGTVRVRRQIVNCDLWVDGDVILEDADASISGGRLVCAGTVRTANLGNSAGARTDVRFGTAPKASRSREVLRKRLAKLQAALDAGRRDWRYVASKSSPTRNLHDNRRTAALGIRLQRLNDLIAALGKRLAALAPDAPLPSTKLVVAGMLHDNVSMQSGDQWVSVEPGSVGFWVSCSTEGCSVEHSQRPPATAETP